MPKRNNPPRTSGTGADWRERLRIAIESSGRKHGAIAADAGVTAETLSRILHSVHSSPRFETILRIARAANANRILDERGFEISDADRRMLADIVETLRGASLAHLEATTPNATRLCGEQARIPPAYHALGARIVYRAEGDSMIRAGIADGDLLFVRPTKALRDANGQVVVFRIAGAEYVRALHVEEGSVRLSAANERYRSIEVDDDQDATGLVGIVVGRLGMLAV